MQKGEEEEEKEVVVVVEDKEEEDERPPKKLEPQDNEKLREGQDKVGWQKTLMSSVIVAFSGAYRRWLSRRMTLLLPTPPDPG